METQFSISCDNWISSSSSSPSSTSTVSARTSARGGEGGSRYNADGLTYLYYASNKANRTGQLVSSGSDQDILVRLPLGDSSSIMHFLWLNIVIKDIFGENATVTIIVQVFPPSHEDDLIKDARSIVSSVDRLSDCSPENKTRLNLILTTLNGMNSSEVSEKSRKLWLKPCCIFAHNTEFLRALLL